MKLETSKLNCRHLKVGSLAAVLFFSSSFCHAVNTEHATDISPLFQARNELEIPDMESQGVLYIGLKTSDGGAEYPDASSPTEEIVRNEIKKGPKLAATIASLQPASACIISVCFGSACAGSVCFGSACSASLCASSGCTVSACAGSACVGSGCFGSGCAGNCGGNESFEIASFNYRRTNGKIEILMATSGQAYAVAGTQHIKIAPGVVNKISVDGSATKITIFDKSGKTIGVYDVAIPAEAS